MDVKYSDLCRRPEMVFAALERNEIVNLYFRGKLKGQVVKPAGVKKKRSVVDNPLPQAFKA